MRQRLFEMLYWLVGRGGATAKELAEHFEISERTVYRDIDALCAAGVPLYAEHGRGGGYAKILCSTARCSRGASGRTCLPPCKACMLQAAHWIPEQWTNSARHSALRPCRGSMWIFPIGAMLIARSSCSFASRS